VLNGKILLRTPYRRVFIQPAAGDSGTAVGVCYHILNDIVKGSRGDVMLGAYAGPAFSDEENRRALEQMGMIFRRYPTDELTQRASQEVADGAIVGWFQGSMEFGPRALGNRSIIADPRRREMKEVLNKRVKKREAFRPFAASILEERVGDYFEQ